MSVDFFYEDQEMRRRLDKTASLTRGIEVSFRNDQHGVGRDYTLFSMGWVSGGLTRVELIRELHVPIPCDSCGRFMCAECKEHGVWPCKTRNVIEGRYRND